eukprot:g1532.t1
MRSGGVRLRSRNILGDSTQFESCCFGDSDNGDESDPELDEVNARESEQCWCPRAEVRVAMRNFPVDDDPTPGGQNNDEHTSAGNGTSPPSLSVPEPVELCPGLFVGHARHASLDPDGFLVRAEMTHFVSLVDKDEPLVKRAVYTPALKRRVQYLQLPIVEAQSTSGSGLARDASDLILSESMALSRLDLAHNYIRRALADDGRVFVCSACRNDGTTMLDGLASVTACTLLMQHGREIGATKHNARLWECYVLLEMALKRVQGLGAEQKVSVTEDPKQSSMCTQQHTCEPKGAGAFYISRFAKRRAQRQARQRANATPERPTSDIAPSPQHDSPVFLPLASSSAPRTHNFRNQTNEKLRQAKVAFGTLGPVMYIGLRAGALGLAAEERMFGAVFSEVASGRITAARRESFRVRLECVGHPALVVLRAGSHRIDPKKCRDATISWMRSSLSSSSSSYSDAAPELCFAGTAMHNFEDEEVLLHSGGDLGTDEYVVESVDTFDNRLEAWHSRRIEWLAHEAHTKELRALNRRARRMAQLHPVASTVETANELGIDKLVAGYCATAQMPEAHIPQALREHMLGLFDGERKRLGLSRVQENDEHDLAALEVMLCMREVVDIIGSMSTAVETVGDIVEAVDIVECATSAVEAVRGAVEAVDIVECASSAVEAVRGAVEAVDIVGCASGAVETVRAAVDAIDILDSCLPAEAMAKSSHGSTRGSDRAVDKPESLIQCMTRHRTRPFECTTELLSPNAHPTMATLVLDRPFEGSTISALPLEIAQLRQLETLTLDHNQLDTLPAEVGALTALKHLGIEANKLTHIPRLDGCQLTQLRAHCNRLQCLPQYFSKEARARFVTLDLSNNRLTKLPSAMMDLHAVTEMWVQHNMLYSLPRRIGRMAQLQTVLANSNQLRVLPPSLGALKNLTWLDLRHNKLRTLPAELGALRSLIHLDLCGNRLHKLPTELFVVASGDSGGGDADISAANNMSNQPTLTVNHKGKATALARCLQRLCVDANRLSSLPPASALIQLKSLQEFTMCNNNLIELPVNALLGLPELRALTMTDNPLLLRLPPQCFNFKREFDVPAGSWREVLCMLREARKLSSDELKTLHVENDEETGSESEREDSITSSHSDDE